MSKDTSQKMHQAAAFIKFFSCEEHYQSFKSGLSLFRPPHFYRARDEPGRGDRSESCFGYWNKGLGDKIPTIKDTDGKTILDSNEATELFIYRESEQKDAWFQCWSFIGPYNGFEHSIERMLEEFGAYFVVMLPSEFRAYIKLIEDISGLNVDYGAVRYSDNPLDYSLTTKASEFSYQKEVRIFVGECSKMETQDKPLKIPDIDQLLDHRAVSLRLKDSNGNAKYWSLGKAKVVTVKSEANTA